MRYKTGFDGNPRADLGSTLVEFGELVDKLFKDPNLKNSRNAQLSNMETFALLYDAYLMIGYTDAETEKFLRNSYNCVAGLGLVHEEDNFTLTRHGEGNYLPKLIANVERRIDLAEGARREGVGYIDKKLREIRNDAA